jgi:hypothetical protein
MEATAKVTGLGMLFLAVLAGMILLAVQHMPPVTLPPAAPSAVKVIYTQHSMLHPEWQQVRDQLETCNPATLWSVRLGQYMKICIDFKTKKLAFKIFTHAVGVETVITMFYPKASEGLAAAQKYVNNDIATGMYQLVEGILPYGICVPRLR